jgi:hypothetical protein
MPNLWTHNIFGDLVAEHGGRRGWLEDDRLRPLFHLGCQGPDFLFYHRFLPRPGKSAMNRLGSRMHREACGPALMQMADAVPQSGAAPDDPLTVYTAGFLMHHVLDRNIHPYVFCKSGSGKWNHQRFEVILDTIVVRRLRGLDTRTVPAWKEIHVGPELPHAVIAVLDRVVAAHYPDMAPHIRRSDWNAAYRDMIRAQKLFHDPTGWKTILTFNQIAPFVYNSRYPQRDYLNEAHGPWRHPALEDVRSTASFWDLWEQALADGKNVWQAAFRYWSEPTDAARRALAAAVGNRSYEHGEDVPLGLAIRYEEPIW